VKCLKNPPVRPEHITNASHFFEPNVAGLESKMVQRESARVHTGRGTGILDNFHCLHHFVTLVADVFYVNRVAFLMILFRKIRLYTAKHVPTRTGEALADSLKKIVRIYARGRGGGLW